MKIKISKRKLKQLVTDINNGYVYITIYAHQRIYYCHNAAITTDKRLIFFSKSTKPDGPVQAFPICFADLSKATDADLRVHSKGYKQVSLLLVDNIRRGKKSD